MQAPWLSLQPCLKIGGYVASISAAWQAADNVALSGLEGIAAGWVTATGRRHRPENRDNRTMRPSRL